MRRFFARRLLLGVLEACAEPMLLNALPTAQPQTGIRVRGDAGFLCPHLIVQPRRRMSATSR